jgi:zinc protease
MKTRACCLSLGLAAVLAGGPLAGQQERFRKVAPPPEPLQQELGLPPLSAPAVLSNGLKVSVAYRDGTGFMGLELLVYAGESMSPDAEPGLATFVASLLGRGTQTRSAAEIEEAVESLGGTFFVTVSQDYIHISLHVLEENLDKALDLLGQILLQPQFLDREIADIRRMITYDLQDREQNPEFVAKRQLYRILFKGHPYEKLTFSRNLLRSWTVREVQDFYDRFFLPNNAHLILTGNVNLSQATRKVSHVLNTWAARDISAPSVKPVRPPEKDRICLIDLPQSRDACYLFVGTAFPRPPTADRAALAVLNQVLGGSLGSRLLMNLREAKEYANYAFSETEIFRAGGLLFVRARVLPDKVVPSIQEIQKEIRSLAGANPAQPGEIEPAKTDLLGNFPIGLERFDQLTARMADIIALGGGEEFWNGYYSQVILVDADRVLKAAQSYLQQPFVTVIAGDRAGLADRLSALDTYDVYDAKGQFVTTYTKDKKGARHEAGGMRPEFQRRPGQE